LVAFLVDFGGDPFSEKHICEFIAFIQASEYLLFLKELDRGLEG
jgi:hypothetical protein